MPFVLALRQRSILTTLRSSSQQSLSLKGIASPRAVGVNCGNICFDVRVQDAHDAGDERQGNIVPFEGLRCLLELFQNTVQVVLSVIPGLVHGGDGYPSPGRSFPQGLTRGYSYAPSILLSYRIMTISPVERIVWGYGLYYSAKKMVGAVRTETEKPTRFPFMALKHMVYK